MTSKLMTSMHFHSFKRARKYLWLILFPALLPLTAQAATLPSSVMPESVGINIHFTRGHEKELDLIAAAGVRVVRTDFDWDEIERYQGVYDWSAYDELAANLAKRGIRPLFILDYSNPLYEGSTVKLWQKMWPYNEVMSPRRPSSVAAFARWAAAAERHFSKYQVIWEIWNEPNISFWRPHPAVAEYTQLALATCQAIRAVNANATVIGPAASGLPWDFMESLFKAGALDCLDGVSVHPYRAQVPETVGPDYARLRKLIDLHTPAQRGKSIPIISSEWGYTSIQYGVHPDDQAAFAVRMQLINLLNGVPLSIWYDWKNDGDDIRNWEHNFGTVGSNLSPKPAYGALKIMTTQLTGYHLVERLKVDSDNDYILLFANAEGLSKIVAWTTRRQHTVRIPLPKPVTKMSQINGLGQRSEIIPDGNRISLTLGNLPAYIAP